MSSSRNSMTLPFYNNELHQFLTTYFISNSNDSQYEDELFRLSTYTQDSWRCDHPMNPTDLAKAGFYYLGNADRVKCAFCDRILHAWEENDKPMEEHKKHSPACRFVQGRQCGNIQINARTLATGFMSTTPPVRTRSSEETCADARESEHSSNRRNMMLRSTVETGDEDLSHPTHSPRHRPSSTSSRSNNVRQEYPTQGRSCASQSRSVSDAAHEYRSSHDCASGHSSGPTRSLEPAHGLHITTSLSDHMTSTPERRQPNSRATTFPGQRQDTSEYDAQVDRHTPHESADDLLSHPTYSTRYQSSGTSSRTHPSQHEHAVSGRSSNSQSGRYSDLTRENRSSRSSPTGRSSQAARSLQLPRDFQSTRSSDHVVSTREIRRSSSPAADYPGRRESEAPVEKLTYDDSADDLLSISTRPSRYQSVSTSGSAHPSRHEYSTSEESGASQSRRTLDSAHENRSSHDSATRRASGPTSSLEIPSDFYRTSRFEHVISTLERIQPDSRATTFPGQSHGTDESEARVERTRNRTRELDSAHDLRSAATANSGRSSQSETIAATSTGTDVTLKECIVCLDREVKALLVPCGHFSYCLECARKLLDRRDTCAICRKRIMKVQEVYI